jgi:hypothetical protein
LQSFMDLWFTMNHEEGVSYAPSLLPMTYYPLVSGYMLNSSNCL